MVWKQWITLTRKQKEAYYKAYQEAYKKRLAAVTAKR